jgi:spermidine synthase
MKPWVTLETVMLEGGERMVLLRRGREFMIELDGYELMSNILTGSEESLATEALARVPAQRILIGGLGMGFTLRAALDAACLQARVVVAELVPQVLKWNQGPLAPMAGHPLNDPRVEVRLGDVALQLREPAQWDAILLDVDNGPQAFTVFENYKLYEPEGIAVLRRALRPGGILGVWSTGLHKTFERRLKRGGFNVETLKIPCREGRQFKAHVLFLARPKGDRAARGEELFDRLESSRPQARS